MTAQQFWAQLFFGLVFFVSTGFLWFYVVRPILEAWGLIRPRDYVTMEAEWSDTRTGSIAGRNHEYRPLPEPVPTLPEPPDRPDFATMVDHLARLSWYDDEGKRQTFSANKIVGMMGGRREEVLEIVRSVRGTEPAPKAPPGPQFEQVGPNSFRRVEGT